MDRQRKQGWGLLFAACCFLWNPVIGVTDILPDAVGYLLLMLGLSALADLDRSEQLLDAQKAFRAMLWVSLGQIAAELLVHVVIPRSSESLNRYQQPMWTLLFAFVLAFFQLYYLLPGWRRFFSGMAALAQFHGGSALLREKRGRTRCERMTRSTMWFVVLHALLTVLPELTILASFEYSDNNPLFTIDWFVYVTPLRAVTGLLSAVVGGIWLVRLLCFLGAAAGDRPWREQMAQEYRTQALADSGLLFQRRMRTALTFFRVGSVFFINLSLSFHSALPDWGCAVLFFCGLLLLGADARGRRPCWIAGGVLLAVGVTRSLLNIGYLREFVPQDALYLPQAYTRYLAVQMTAVLESVLLAVFVLLTMRLLTATAAGCAARYAGQRPAGAGWSAEQSGRRIFRRSLPAWIFLGLSLAAKICEIFLQQTYSWIWLVQFVLSFVAALCFAGYLNQFSEEVTTCCPVRPHV